MSLTQQQQFQKIARESKTILIFLPKHPQGDVIGSAWALAHLFEKQERHVTVASDTLSKASAPYHFLKQPNLCAETLSGARDFVLSFSTKHNKIHGIRTEEVDQEYRIYITPESGSVDPRDFSFVPARFKFDLVIVLGAPDKESVGKLYEQNADIFYEVPVINIDNHPKNENFGQLNIVDITASSVSEIVTDLIRNLYAEWTDEIVSECLLAGVIAATDSFQKKNTTPKALQYASWLMDQGADQQKIVQYLYKTQPLHLLKLWGLIMARLGWIETTKLVWAPVTQSDFDISLAKENDLPSVLEKIKLHYSSGLFFLLLFQESPSHTRALIKTASQEDLEKIAALWKDGTVQDDTLIFTLSETSAETAFQNIAAALRSVIVR